MIDFTFSLNPIWQCLAQIKSAVALAFIAGPTQWLQIPNKASALFANGLDVIDSQLIEREFLITHKATKLVELTKGIPFGCGIRAARLGYSSTARHSAFSILPSSFFGRVIFLFDLFVLVGLMVLRQVSFSLAGFLITFCSGNSFRSISEVFQTCVDASFTTSAIAVFKGRTSMEMAKRLRFFTVYTFGISTYFETLFIELFAPYCLWRFLLFASLASSLKPIPTIRAFTEIGVWLRIVIRAFSVAANFQILIKKCLSFDLASFADHWLASFTEYKRAFVQKLGRTPIAPKVLPEQRPKINNNSYSIIRQNQHDWQGYYTINQGLF